MELHDKKKYFVSMCNWSVNPKIIEKLIDEKQDQAYQKYNIYN